MLFLNVYLGRIVFQPEPTITLSSPAFQQPLGFVLESIRLFISCIVVPSVARPYIGKATHDVSPLVPAYFLRIYSSVVSSSVLIVPREPEPVELVDVYILPIFVGECVSEV